MIYPLEEKTRFVVSTRNGEMAECETIAQARKMVKDRMRIEMRTALSPLLNNMDQRTNRSRECEQIAQSDDLLKTMAAIYEKYEEYITKE